MQLVYNLLEYEYKLKVKTKCRPLVLFSRRTILRCLVLLFDNILYVPHAVGILLEIP